MDRGDQYLSIDTNTNLIESLFVKVPLPLLGRGIRIKVACLMGVDLITGVSHKLAH